VFVRRAEEVRLPPVFDSPAQRDVVRVFCRAMVQRLSALFTQTFGVPPTAVAPVQADGSQRVYLRLTGGPDVTVIGAMGPDAEENRAFLSYSRSLRGIGLPVPEIYAVDEAHGLWLEQDLGDITLFRALTAARLAEPGPFPASVVPVYERVVDLLPRFQVEGGRAVDFSVAYPRPAFDQQSMMWDLNYFKYHFLKLAHVPFREQRLENDFQKLVEHLQAADASYFLYRDFQSRNIMLLEGEPWFIDYQGGRRGAPHYDIASLLYDAKADIPDDVRQRLLERYVAALGARVPIDASRFVETYRGFVLIRIMQAMGAYGYRGYFERKSRFLESVPYAARNVATLLDAGLPIDLPEVKAVFQHIVEAWADRARPAGPPAGLTVHIGSFSYRQALPADDTGHGGGFVFDCRSLPNPGRYSEFAGVTGLDPPVIAFLEAAPEIETFWRHVAPLVDAHIANFQGRNFTDLAVAFGCTGGQHRSVYFAERLARHVRERYPEVTVRLQHHERPRWPQRDDAAALDSRPGLARPAVSDPIEPWTR
jgi:aminoglycoside/choline kinase family phosphotransferase